MFVTFTVDNSPSTQITYQQLLQGYVPPAEQASQIISTRTMQADLANFTGQRMNRINNARRFINTVCARYVDQDMATQYASFRIPKHSGGFRQIDAPNPILKTDLARIKDVLEGTGILAHTAAYAYVPGRCAKNSIERHQKRKHTWYLKLDLHNFFGSCTQEFILQQLNQILIFNTLGDECLNNLTKIAMLNGGLPQGSPLSPWLTNQIMLPIDYEISTYCKQHNVTYTRYADDMLFSTTSKAFLQNNVISKMQEILQNTPLRLNTEKTKISSIYGQNWNLGLMVNKDNKITVGTKKKERFRACLHDFAQNNENWSKTQTQEFLGTMEYFHSIEPEYFGNLLTRYNEKFNMDIRATAQNKVKD